MKIQIYLLLLIVILVGCGPIEPASPEPGQGTSPAPAATDTPPPALPATAEGTPIPFEPTAAYPQPTDPVLIASAQQAVQAAIRFLISQLGLHQEDIQVLGVTAVEWPDACLGIPAEREMCAQVITPGFVITLAADVDGVLEYFTFHTDTSGESLRVLPAALVQARQALTELTGLPLEQIRLLRFEAVEWRDSCLGVITPGMNCLEVITPGYRIVFEADGMEYEYHTNQDGSHVVLGTGQEIELLPEWLLTWTSPGEPCNTLELSLARARFGSCGGALEDTGIPFPQRLEQLLGFAGLYAPFESPTAAGVVSLRGIGQVLASAAEMRMLAEWSQLIYDEVVSGRGGAAWGLAFSWHRQGGIAGFCDDLAVYLSGEIIYSSCQAVAGSGIQTSRLDALQLEQLYGWIDSLEAFEMEQSDPGTADALHISLVFNGSGANQAEENTQHAVLDLAAELAYQAQFPVPAVVRAAAEQVLTDYLAALRGADYAAAAALYGGSYEIMLEQNPHLDPTDHTALFEAACTVNGAACGLSLRSVVHVAATGADMYRFTVELQNQQGALFELGPCCGALPEENPPVTQFVFQVAMVEGHFLVITPPVYAG